MEIRLESKTATPLRGIQPVLTAIEQRLHREPAAWLQQLQTRPESFAALEKDVHRTFQQMADQLVAGLLAQATQADDFAATAKKK